MLIGTRGRARIDRGERVVQCGFGHPARHAPAARPPTISTGRTGRTGRDAAGPRGRLPAFHDAANGERVIHRPSVCHLPGSDGARDRPRERCETRRGRVGPWLRSGGIPTGDAGS